MTNEQKRMGDECWGWYFLAALLIGWLVFGAIGYATYRMVKGGIEYVRAHYQTK